jgi:ABC-type amino acid transport substrate-binding protein
MMRVAMDPSFPPFEYIDETGAVAGLDVELAGELARRLGVQAHFVVTTYDGLYDALTVDRADVIISAVYPDLSRSADFIFSSPYFNAGQVVMVPRESDVQSVSDLTGRRVLVVFGTDGHMEVLRWEETLVPPPTILTVDDAAALIRALDSGVADSAVVNNVSAQTALDQGLELRVLDAFVTHEPYVIVAQEEDAELMGMLNGYLEEMRADGTLRNLRARWLR